MNTKPLAKSTNNTPPTRDGFFNGKFEVLQPADGGHRAGLDALLLSACVPVNFTGRVADFGAGAGVAGMAVACRSFTAEVKLVERDANMADLAERSLKLPLNSRFCNRVSVICADILLSGKEREEAGLANSTYDHIVMNPPFNDPSHRPSPVLVRQEAHIMGEGGLDPWLRTAAATLKSNGRLALIFRPSGLGQILAAFQGRFGAAQIIPVHPKQNKEANRILVLATKGARGAVSILPGFVVHEEDGAFTQEADAIFCGDAVLPQLSSD
jgi:tRNA1(Val) A37 N6-methylase TrmN6